MLAAMLKLMNRQISVVSLVPKIRASHPASANADVDVAADAEVDPNRQRLVARVTRVTRQTNTRLLVPLKIAPWTVKTNRWRRSWSMTWTHCPTISRWKKIWMPSRKLLGGRTWDCHLSATHSATAHQNRVGVAVVVAAVVAEVTEIRIEEARRRAHPFPTA